MKYLEERIFSVKEEVNLLMLELEIIEDFSDKEQEFKTWKLVDNTTCLATLSNEYRTLRTVCKTPLNQVNVEGIGVVNTTQIKSYLEPKTIPFRQKGSFDVVRSDIGETLAYILLEQNYGTQIGSKGVQNRELVQSVSRGIDVVGVENNGILTLVLGEAKVSNQDRNPPDVVDTNRDSISKTLRAHIKNHQETSRKIWDVIRKCENPVIKDLLLAAAIYWDEKMWSFLRIICCGILVRPLNKYSTKDFGLLKGDPGLLSPAKVRFLIVCVNDDLDNFVSEFYRMVIEKEDIS